MGGGDRAAWWEDSGRGWWGCFLLSLFRGLLSPGPLTGFGTGSHISTCGATWKLPRPSFFFFFFDLLVFLEASLHRRD